MRTKSLAERVARFRPNPTLDAWLARIRTMPPPARPAPPPEQLPLFAELPMLPKDAWRRRLRDKLLRH